MCVCFHFKQEVRVLQSSPTKGLRSGGTEVEVIGENLDIGNSVSVTMGEQQCVITELKSNRLRFITVPQSPDATSNKTKIVMKHDDGFSNDVGNFHYVADPRVTSVLQTTTLLSGGVDVIFVGSNLDVSKRATMTLRVVDENQSMTRRRRDADRLCEKSLKAAVYDINKREVNSPEYDVIDATQDDIVSSLEINFIPVLCHSVDSNWVVSGLQSIRWRASLHSAAPGRPSQHARRSRGTPARV